MAMNLGCGESFISLEDGKLGPTISVTKLADSYVALTVSQHGVGVMRAVINNELADSIGAALRRAAKKD
jgi:hypothetical protein